MTSQRDSSGVTREMVEEALEEFRGVILQTPPMYSALKRQGKRLYDLARQGVEVEREPRKVEVSRMELMEWRPPDMVLSIQCSRGAYIRSLAHDLGGILGCGGHLAALRRTRSGVFRIDAAVPLEGLGEAGEGGGWERYLLPVDFPVLHLKSVTLNPGEERMVRNGQGVRLSPHTHSSEHGEGCRAYSLDGRFVAVVRFNRPLRLWEPRKVFQLAAPSPYVREGSLV